MAERGARFEQAVAGAPLTLPSHATIMTGLRPPNHGARDNGRYLLGEANETLAETFRDNGYDTAAFVACFVLDERFGLAQGFDLYDIEVTRAGYRPQMPDFNERPADAVTDAVAAWLDARADRGATDPFFLWVHYFDAHMPRTSPNIGEPTHGMLLYDCTIRVPLIISSPTLFDGEYVIMEQLAGHVDLRRTLEALVGFEHRAPSDGVDLLRERGARGRAIYSETEAPLHQYGWSPLRSMRGFDAKYIDGPDPEFYDLARDPDERKNIIDRRPARMAELVDALERIDGSGTGSNDETAERSLSDEEIERLAALWYVQANVSNHGDSLADPKSMMPLLRRSSSGPSPRC